jgi:hypothetical protein
MMVGTSISDEVDGIRAPGMGQIRLFAHGMAARRSFIDRITLQATVRPKRIACGTSLRHDFRVGRIPHGESGLKGFSPILSTRAARIAGNPRMKWPPTNRMTARNNDSMLPVMVGIPNAAFSFLVPARKLTTPTVPSIWFRHGKNRKRPRYPSGYHTRDVG